MNHKVHIFILLLVLSGGFFLRFYKLGEIPFGFYQDESAIGYNAYSIIKTGKDEHGQPFPLYFKSFGDYKLPVYIYITALSIQMFGLNEFAVRFPSALFGFLTIILFYFFLKQVTGNKTLATISTIFLAINPWHVHYSRATFEVSITLFFLILGGLLIYRGLHYKTTWLFFWGTVCFIVSLYTYNLSRLLAPVLYIVLIWIYKERLAIIPKKELFSTVTAIILLLVPFITAFFHSGGVYSARGTLLFSSASVEAPLIEFRSYVNDMFSSFYTKAFFNMWELKLWQYIQNIISYFSVPFFFIAGSPHGNHGIGNVGQLYLFEFPLVIIGILSLARKEQRGRAFFLLWGVATILVASLTREAPHATRSFPLIVTLEFLSGVGVFVLIENIKIIRNKYKKLAILLSVSLLAIYNFIYYFTSYYIRFPILYAKQWRLEDKAVALYIKENQDKYNKIIFDSEGGYIYSSLLFYLKYKPEEFHKSVVWYEDDSEGFSMVKSFGKFEFRTIDWSKDSASKKTLIITTADRKPKEIPPLKAFFYPKRPVVLSIKQEIVQYPIEEIAYVVVESK